MLSQEMINLLQKEIIALRKKVKIETESKDILYDAMREAEENYEDKVKEIKSIEETIYDMKNMLKIEGIENDATIDMEGEYI